MTKRRISLIAPLPPLTSGVAPFNAALLRGLSHHGEVDAIGWRRLYPALPGRRDAGDALRDDCETAPLDWMRPRTWRTAVDRVRAFAPETVILPWLHPVMAPPYRWMLRRLPSDAARVLICHNVLPHERRPFDAAATRAVLRHADILVTHARGQRDELHRLGARGRIVEAFLPRVPACGHPPAAAAVRDERRRQGNPDLSLLAFGAVRPYKGIDVALDALDGLPSGVRVHLTVAGRMWQGAGELRERARRLGIDDRVEFVDRYVPDDEAAMRFAACDAVILPYRSASQSGVVQLAFAHGRPVIATRVGGLPQSVRHGIDGLLCAPEDPRALADAILAMLEQHERLTAGVSPAPESSSQERYAGLILDAVGGGRP